MTFCVDETQTLIKGCWPVSGLGISDLQDIIQQPEPLLKTFGQIDLTGLLNALKPAFHKKSINGIVGLLGNAEKLLSGEFVDETQALIKCAGPLLGELSKFDLQE